MLPLFTTDKNNLADFFETITEDDIQDCCDLKIYHRGQEYLNSITEAIFNSTKTRLEATVIGRSEYTVSIELKNGELSDLWMRVPSERSFSVSISSYSNKYEVLNRDMDGNIKVYRIWKGDNLPDQISPDVKIKALENILGELIIRKKYIDK